MYLLVKSDSLCQPVVSLLTVNAISVACTTLKKKIYKYALNMLCFQALVVKDQYQSASQELGFI